MLLKDSWELTKHELINQWLSLTFSCFTLCSQCESCLCWQHGTCMGLYEDNVPHHYICYYCRHAAGQTGLCFTLLHLCLNSLSVMDILSPFLRLEAKPALALGAWLADFRAHVRPVVHKGKLLWDQLRQDHTHQTFNGSHAWSQSGPQWTAAED